MRKGSARRVLLICRKYAVKIACFRLREAWRWRKWREIFEGFKANRSERQKWKSSHDACLCPILWADKLGVFVVMPYARPLTEEEFSDLERKHTIQRASALSSGKADNGDFRRVNYGMIREKVVKIDYEEPSR